MKVQDTAFDGVFLLEPQRHGDDRGYFSETWNKARMAQAGLEYDFVQDNHSLSEHAGTVRGLHCQAPPHGQAKLVRCVRGHLSDIIVDYRKGSPTFGQWISVDLTPQNGLQVLIPVGFLHGFVTRLPGTEILYKTSDYYAPDCDMSVRWDDPEIGIDWGLAGTTAMLSPKDSSAPLLSEIDCPFEYRR